MNRYIYRIMLDVEIDAYTESDAREAIENALDDECDIDVVDMEILEYDQLK